MSITVGEILRVVAIMGWTDGNIMENVFNMVVTGTGGPFDEEDIVGDALDWLETMYANMTSFVSENVAGSEVRVYVYDPVDDDWDEIGSDAWTWTPNVTADELPRAISVLINAKTSDPDVNGKKYLGGITEGGVALGLINSITLTAAALFAVDWLTAFTGAVSGASLTPGIWSPTRTNFLVATGTYLIPAIAAYQRRRKRGIGI